MLLEPAHVEPARCALTALALGCPWARAGRTQPGWGRAQEGAVHRGATEYCVLKYVSSIDSDL
eukprot:2365097-Prymnesium_polylepis.2